MKKNYLNFNPFFFKLINLNEKVEFLIGNFTNFIFSNSLSFEDIFTFYIFNSKNIHLNNFTINTGLIKLNNVQFLNKLKKNIINLFPEKDLINFYIKKYSLNGFYNNIFLRKLCCQIRKVLNFDKIIKYNNLWITSLTKYQSLNRKNIKEYEYLKSKNILKYNIIYNWKFCDIFYFLEKFDILLLNNYELGYLSSGCEPCTIPVFLNQKLRKGRWWWEILSKSECGLHE